MVLFAQDFSNKGKEFWIGYGHHVRMINNTPWPSTACVRQGNGEVCPEKMELYITSDVSTQGKVEIPGIGFSQPFTVTANQITTVEIPRAAGLPDEGKFNSGIHVTAEKAVVVYSFIYVSAISGATLCLPVATLGREYISVNYDQVSNEPNTYSYFFVVAADTGKTRVEITPANATKNGQPANVPFVVELNQGEVYQVLSSTDLTGSAIKSISDGRGCKKIAVFSGSSKISLGCAGTGSSDNLYQQVYPTSTWGKTYLFAPSVNSNSTNGQNNFFRVVKSDPAAIIKYNGTVYPTGTSSYATFPVTNQPGIVESDKPIMVAQYFTTQSCAGNTGQGDPDMIYLNPVEQTINKVTLNAMQPSVNTNINQHFINVIVKNDPLAISSFTIDGVNYGSSFTTHPAAPGYAYARIGVSRGTHNLYCDTPFNAIAYGFGNAESYGYSAGTNLRDLYQFVSIKNLYGTVSFPAGCKSSPLQFSMTFPYQPLSITWKFNGLFNDTTLFDPVYDSTWVLNGRTIYRYKLDRSYQVDKTGTYPIMLVANNPSADGCSGIQEIEYDLQIFDPPQASFQTVFSGCIADSVKFADISNTGNIRPVIRRNWDFGDGSVSGVLNPVIKYAAGGTYNASLRVITDIGCISETAERPVVVSNTPMATFEPSGPFCEEGRILLNDSSKGFGTSLAKWYWDHGDGSLDSTSSGPAFSHNYAKAGTYSVSLTVRNALGCVSAALKKNITVFPKPVAGFGLPEICLDDAFALFPDSSSIADNSVLAHTWDFGDGNTGTGISPRHKYSKASNYNVVQYVSSVRGCKDTLNQPFTVNGAVPQAGLEVVGSVFCSNRSVTIRNKSTVDFGNITRLAIQWDINDATNIVIDEAPLPDKIYTHQYTRFSQPATKTITIKMSAFSGGVCQGEITRQVVLQGSPSLRFDAIPEVCDNIAPFTFTQGRDISGLTARGKYIGAGMTTDSVFNPSRAGKGVHQLLYVSTTSAGCTDTIQNEIVVHETPKVDGGPDRITLEGTSITLEANAGPGAVTFRWSPPDGLDNANVLRPSASPKKDVNYILTVESAKGCIGKDEVFVRYLPKLVIPNTFTPNNDGYNDKWEIRGMQTYIGCVIEVFNTAGTLMFRSVGYGQDWDGTFQGKQLPAGTYYYVIDPKNSRPRISGYVTIIR